MAGLLHHISLQPHTVALDTMALIQARILDPARALPASQQAEAFSDTALLQVNLLPMCLLSARLVICTTWCDGITPSPLSTYPWWKAWILGSQTWTYTHCCSCVLHALLTGHHCSWFA